MKETLRLGSIAGVRVGAHWSVALIFLLIAVLLAARQFPLLFPDLGAGAYIAAGVVTAVIFLMSLLAHEVSHAVVAQRNDVGVEGITLWALGGVAKLQGEAADPGRELRISAVGPLVSVVLGVVFYGIAFVLQAVEAPEIVVGALVWLAFINVVLAVFNLVPAAPLDGGRILTSWLWKRRGDRRSAAITASRAGVGFGMLLVGGGFLLFLFLGALDGLWLVFLGWFLIQAATGEQQHARVSGALGGTTVGDVMSPDPTTVPADVTIDEFVDRYVFPNRYSSFPLVESDGTPAGLVTLGRVKKVAEEERSSTRVRDVACGLDDIPVIEPDERLADLLPRMQGCADGRALVVSDERLVGIVSPTDVMRRIDRAELRREGDHQRT